MVVFPHWSSVKQGLDQSKRCKILYRWFTYPFFQRSKLFNPISFLQHHCMINPEIPVSRYYLGVPTA